MKRCPTCKQTFIDRNLSFCIDDGTPLLPVVESLDPTPDEETIVSPSARPRVNRESEPAAYQPPGGYLPPGTPSGRQGKRKSWPWVVGCSALLLIVIVGLVITAKILFPDRRDASSRTNNNKLNANVDQRSNSNANLNERNSDSNSTNWNENANDNADADDGASPPTEQEKVLADLENMENEWTVANINADKKKLNRILADDYVGTTFDGTTQGKADYLRTIKRDTSIQKWEFDDLKVSLLGDRASLTGVLRLEVQNRQGQVVPAAFRFTDKFVWRDNRWQAVSSEVKQEQ